MIILLKEKQTKQYFKVIDNTLFLTHKKHKTPIKVQIFNGCINTMVDYAIDDTLYVRLTKLHTITISDDHHLIGMCNYEFLTN